MRLTRIFAAGMLAAILAVAQGQAVRAQSATPVADSPSAPRLMDAPQLEAETSAGLSVGPCCRDRTPHGVFTAEYLLWWVRHGPLPAPLVTTGNVNTGDPATSSGPLTGPGTTVAFGGRPLDFDAFSGGRWTWESWSVNVDCVGLQLGGFRLEQRSIGFRVASDTGGKPIIARPHFDTLDQQELATTVAFPGAAGGAIGVRADCNLWGIESNLMVRGRWDGCRRTQWLFGFRHLDLDETIEAAQTTAVLRGGGSFNNVDLDPGNVVTTLDRFRGRNEFYGALLGFQTETIRDCWSLGLSLKLSLGADRQEVHAVGGSARFGPAGALADTAYGGVLAVRTNSGIFRADDFVVIPELGLKASCQVNCRLRAFFGYDFLYWSNVVRPGNQVDRNINLRHVPTSDMFNSGKDSHLPAPLFRQSDFWAQGISLGLELKY